MHKIVWLVLTTLLIAANIACDSAPVPTATPTEVPEPTATATPTPTPLEVFEKELFMEQKKDYNIYDRHSMCYTTDHTNEFEARSAEFQNKQNFAQTFKDIYGDFDTNDFYTIFEKFLLEKEFCSDYDKSLFDLYGARYGELHSAQMYKRFYDEQARTGALAQKGN